MQKRSIRRAQINALLEKLHSLHKLIYAPQKLGTQVDFAPLGDLQNLTLDHIQTVRSAKAALFPPVEELLRYQRSGVETELQDHDLTHIPEQVLFGTRPCDAAAIAPLTAVFTTDDQDAIFAKRLEQTTVISVSCERSDGDCFCTSVGVRPGDTRGSDILLTRLKDDEYLAEIITAKGESLLQLASELFGPEPAESKEAYLAKVEKRFDWEALHGKLAGAFDHPFWLTTSLACLGCGACAYVCPVCSCFDIQDEGLQKKGRRVRSWDSCGLALFTLHASGHNPRAIQSQRWRQRMLHKFSYMPDQLQQLGCVGCGRCSRACPADMNLIEQVENFLSA
ncbi:hydrogenase subunit beta [bacterium]|nr:hydrogenase subunit beta [bacterium]